jgi:peptide deformylase
MTVLKLVIAPDPRLNQVSEEVKPEEINDDLRKFMDDMLDTMYEYYGLGLSAVQVGNMKRIVVMDVAQGSIRYDGTKDPDASPDPIFMINPEIVESSKEKFSFEEGCLSFPTQFAEIERPAHVKVKYLDYNGNEQIKDFGKLASICVQHEIDHLNGITFPEHLSKLKKDKINNKLKKMKKKGFEYQTKSGYEEY